MAAATQESYQGDDDLLVRRHSPTGSPAKRSAGAPLGSSPIAAEVLSSLKKTLFVLGSCIVIFIAVRNSLTLHLQNFWGASGDFWQHQWDKLLNTFGDDSFNLVVYGSVVVSYVVYWSVGIFYIIMDVTLRPQAFRKYKIQPGTNEPVDTWQLLKVIGVVHFNQTVITALAMWCSYHLMQWRGYDQSPSLPTFHWVIFELVVCILMEEVGFYYSHRLFHHRVLYKHFHKMHHEWQSPISITALYSHPLEHFISNLLPGFLGPFILGSHVSTAWLWFQIAQFGTLNAHSGYHLPFFPSNEAHDYHHLKFNQCYGVLGVLDLLHGTDERFRNSKCFPRHVTTLSLTPVRVLFPDQDHDIKPKSLMQDDDEPTSKVASKAELTSDGEQECKQE